VQPHWSVSAPALVAAEATSTPAALQEAAAAAREVAIDRAYLVRRLAELGLSVAGVPRAPFVLVPVPDGDVVRAELRAAGFAVRRGDSFPGLGPDWLRLAVRDAATTDALIEAWGAIRRGMTSRTGAGRPVCRLTSAPQG
jgi:histidinol-phosphate aminotransferase